MKSVLIGVAIALFSTGLFAQSESPTISKVRISRLSPFTSCVAGEIESQTGIYNLKFTDLISLTGTTHSSRIQMVFAAHITPSASNEIMTLNLFSQDPQGWHFSRIAAGEGLAASSASITSFGVLSSNNSNFDHIMITLVNCSRLL